MYLIVSQKRDPLFNIAAEEFMLKQMAGDVIYFYVNNPSVIIGKHQNSYAEINYPFLRDRNIPLIRRLSGGGTVYHDQGNVNFSFVMDGEEGKLVDFRKFINPIIHALGHLGLNVVYGGRNDLLLNGKKISGNAEHVFKNRTLHHGTLLYSSNLDFLEESIRVKQGRFRDKAVQSVRSKVTNIQPHLQVKLSIHEFITHLSAEMMNYFKNCLPYTFTDLEIKEIKKLVTEKYSTWEWNYGYSPGYELTNTINIDGKNSKILILVEKGIIRNIRIEPGYRELENWVNRHLTGQNHEFKIIAETIKGADFAPLKNLTDQDIIQLFF
ncbi:MAG: lipoate--protein ligase family protein [Bacteroidota bacterium]